MMADLATPFEERLGTALDGLADCMRDLYYRPPQDSESNIIVTGPPLASNGMG